MPHVQAERHSAGDHIADIRMYIDLSDGGSEAIRLRGMPQPTINSAAAHSASRRMFIGTVPAWPASP